MVKYGNIKLSKKRDQKRVFEMKRLYVKMMWLFNRKKLEKLSTKKLIKLWNLFDIYAEDELKLVAINNVLNERAIEGIERECRWI